MASWTKINFEIKGLLTDLKGLVFGEWPLALKNSKQTNSCHRFPACLFSSFSLGMITNQFVTFCIKLPYQLKATEIK